MALLWTVESRIAGASCDRGVANRCMTLLTSSWISDSGHAVRQFGVQVLNTIPGLLALRAMTTCG